MKLALGAVATILNSQLALEEKRQLIHGGCNQKLIKGVIVLKGSIKEKVSHDLARKLIEIEGMQSIWVKKNLKDNSFEIGFFAKFDGSQEDEALIEIELKNQIGLEKMHRCDLSKNFGLSLTH